MKEVKSIKCQKTDFPKEDQKLKNYYKYNTKRCLITNEYSETNTLHIYNDQIRSIKEAWYTTGDKK